MPCPAELLGAETSGAGRAEYFNIFEYPVLSGADTGASAPATSVFYRHPTFTQVPDEADCLGPASSGARDMTVEAQREALFEYLLRLGDNALVLAHRLSEWGGRRPGGEGEAALSGIALDLAGQAKLWLELAATVEGGTRDAEALALKRGLLDWRNFLLVEQPNGDFANTIVRQFLFDCFQAELLQALSRSANHEIAAIAAGALKKALSHRRHSGEWVIKLGGGTEETHAGAQAALDALWGYTRELFEGDAIDEMMMQAGIAPDPGDFEENWKNAVGAVLAEATLEVPDGSWSIGGGKKGIHSEHLARLLAEMQFLPRAYPDAQS